MFKGCSSLTSLNLKSFKTENVKNMSYIFENCFSLTSLNLKSFKTENVNKIFRMFYGCRSLKQLNLISFNYPKANSFCMFNECKKLSNFICSDQNIMDSFNTVKKFLINYLVITYYFLN